MMLSRRDLGCIPSRPSVRTHYQMRFSGAYLPLLRTFAGLPSAAGQARRV